MEKPGETLLCPAGGGCICAGHLSSSSRSERRGSWQEGRQRDQEGLGADNSEPLMWMSLELCNFPVKQPDIPLEASVEIYAPWTRRKPV